MKPRSMFYQYTYWSYSYKQPAKAVGFTNLSEKTSSGNLIGESIPRRNIFPDEHFFPNAKVELQIKTENGISIVNRIND